MPHKFIKILILSLVWIIGVIGLSGCASPSDPPQPVGKRVAVNPVRPTPPEQIKAVLLPELKDL